MSSVDRLVAEARELLNHPQLPTWDEEHLRLARANALIGLAQLTELSRISAALTAQQVPASPLQPPEPAAAPRRGPPGRCGGARRGHRSGVKELLAEERLAQAVHLLEWVVEAAGALVVFVGAAVAFGGFAAALVRRRGAPRFTPVRLELGRYLALGLEFQLAADILRTAIAPSLREIGELAAIAAIRTILNYFLRREIREEGAALAAERRGGAG
ncbi:MAG TPA: DUF1622 domain-containing protein [Pilimelia sp.]|nr:DUF1622 domain-containing protein [Pilimelia sp.]